MITPNNPSSAALPGYRTGDERLIRLTESAGRKVQSLLEKQGRPAGVLRVAVIGGGCSGLQYKMDLQDQPANRDILVQTGGADPMITKEVVEGFEKEMTDAGANYKVIVYPNAKHAFTNPDADKVGMEALAYDAEADQKSWEEAKKFLAEVFGS